MLVLARKKTQAIRIGDITIRVLELSASRVRLGIDAPPDIRIVREELEDREPDADAYDGPRCSKCKQPIPFATLPSWETLCDSCAVACENDADARREQRRHDP